MKESLQQIISFRLDKLKNLRKRGINPYPSKSRRTHSIAELLDKFGAIKRAKKKVTLTGRLMAKREFGGLTFGVLKDFSGEIQILFKRDKYGKAAYNDLELLDIGDMLQVTGVGMVTKKGENTLLVSNMTLLAKSLRPLPEKWHGLTDLETRFRQRHLDLLLNDEVKERFIIRHKLVQTIREFLLKEGFIEVDTPALQPLPGGALATPFKTHYDAIDADVYLRIAPELYLKRLIIGGFERVFEFAKVFRNEGISTQHLQDFEMLEFYMAYATYEDLMKMTEKMLSSAVKKVMGTTRIKFKGKTIDFKAPWPRKSFRELILDSTGIDVDKFITAEGLKGAIKKKKIKLTYSGTLGRGRLIDELYKEKVRPGLFGPMFLVDHPVDLSPLAKKKEGDNSKVQQFQLVIGGMEIVKAYSELNDPIDQRERFKQQNKLRRAGDTEAHSMDEDFLVVLEHGMPPTAGWGMGIDRFLAVLTDAESIREAVLFPFVKDK